MSGGCERIRRKKDELLNLTGGGPVFVWRGCSLFPSGQLGERLLTDLHSPYAP